MKKRFLTHFIEVDNIISRILAFANGQWLLNPDGNSKHHDFLTLYALKRGKQLLWDYLCASTLADTYLDKLRKALLLQTTGDSRKVQNTTMNPQYIFLIVHCGTVET